MRRLVVAALCVAAACGRAAERGHPPNNELLSHLPASAALVVGMTRGGSEAELLAAFKMVSPALDAAGVPHCVVAAAAKIETLVVAVSPTEPRVVVLARGPGLRAAAEACLRASVPALSALAITDEAQVTRYSVEDRNTYIAWLDGDTALAGPYDSEDRTAALRALPPLTGNAAMLELLGKVDAAGALWAAADGRALGDLARGVLPDGVSVERAWAQIDSSSFVLDAVLETSAPEQAAKVLALVQQLRGRAPANVAGVLDVATVKADGGRVTVRADVGAVMQPTTPGQPLPRATATMAVDGALAAIILPAFEQRVRKQKTIEATHNLMLLQGSAASRFDEARRAGQKAPPASVGPTPPLGACCRQPGQVCAPDPSLWSDPAWQRLKFSVTTPSRYSYQLTSKDQGDGTWAFTVSAYGDLDCDGVYSTFETRGAIDANQALIFGGLTSEKALE